MDTIISGANLNLDLVVVWGASLAIVGGIAILAKAKQWAGF